MSRQSVLANDDSLNHSHPMSQRWVKLTPLMTPTPRRKGKPYFRNQVALALSLTKIVTGGLIISAGVLALHHHAALSAVGAGLWSGCVILLAGFLGLMMARQPNNKIYVLSFMALSFLSFIGSVLLVYFASIGFVKDYGGPGEEVIFNQTVIQRESKRPAIIMNCILLLLGALDVVLSLLSLALCVKQTWFGSEDHSRRRPIPIYFRHSFPKDKLLRWIHHPRMIPQWVSPQAFSVPSTIYKPQPYVPDSSANNSYRSSSQFSSQHDYLHRTLETQSLQKAKKKTKKLRQHRRAAKHHLPLARDQRTQTTDSSPPEITEEEIQKTYTGLDKTMAENFIKMYMEPHRRLMSKSTL